MTPITTADIDRLRRRIERIEASPTPRAPVQKSRTEEPAPYGFEEPPKHYDAETCLDGVVMENAHGSYFLAERFYPGHKLHGSLEVSRLGEMPGAWLEAISENKIPAHAPSRWVFLDTETTGLAGGTGTCAFLIGVGTIEDGGFRVRLFFMRDYDEERAMLWALAEFLRHYDVLVTYNGKSYDAPLIETRYRLQRQKFPLERLHHLDLLHGARRLWKLRMKNCRLMNLENEILGVEREGDVPGEMIPYYYFEYLRTRQALRLVPLFHHNVLDIVSLAALTAVVLEVYAAPEASELRHGADLLGLARWLRRSGDHEGAAGLYRRAVQAGMMDEELFAALWETALLEKKLGRRDQMLVLLEDLTKARNAHRGSAYEELAKHYEHKAKDDARALEMTREALALAESPQLERRKLRLEKRLARAASTPPRLAELS